jgi:hypothetical protein
MATVHTNSYFSNFGKTSTFVCSFYTMTMMALNRKTTGSIVIKIHAALYDAMTDDPIPEFSQMLL